MSKTEELRKVIKAQLDNTPGQTFAYDAPKDANFPYKVFTLKSVDLGDFYRDDIIMDVDIWDNSDDFKQAEIIADSVENIFNCKSYPSGNVFPTFFREDRKTVPDNQLQHILLTFTIQNYYTGG